MPLNFRLVLVTHRPEILLNMMTGRCFSGNRISTLTPSHGFSRGLPAPMSCELVPESILLIQELDISDADILAVAEKIADWQAPTEGLWAED